MIQNKLLNLQHWDKKIGRLNFDHRWFKLILWLDMLSISKHFSYYFFNYFVLTSTKLNNIVLFRFMYNRNLYSEHLAYGLRPFLFLLREFKMYYKPTSTIIVNIMPTVINSFSVKIVQLCVVINCNRITITYKTELRSESIHSIVKILLFSPKTTK